jgi:hypothetical protein
MRERIFACALRPLGRHGGPIRAGWAVAFVFGILPVALPASAVEPSQQALLRIHLTSDTSIPGMEGNRYLDEVDWDVLISTSGKMEGFTTCGCNGSLTDTSCQTGLWTTVASTAQLSAAQLSTLRAALTDGAVGLQPSCSYVDDSSLRAGSYELQWYGRQGRSNIITMSLGPTITTPACSDAELALFKTIDDLVIDELGFPPTLAPETPINRRNACGE